MRVMSSGSKLGHRPSKAIFGVLGLSLMALVGFGVLKSGTTRPMRGAETGTTAKNSQQILAEYGQLPMRFELNQGQVESRVKFLARGSGYTLFLTQQGAVIKLQEPVDRKGNPPVPAAQEGMLQASSRQGAILRLALAGSNPASQVAALNELQGKSNYFIGNSEKDWHTNIPAYAKVRYGQVYPGVDLVYYGRQGKLENDFVVEPGADPGRIRLKISGADKLAVEANGNLVLTAGSGDVRFDRPVAYQEFKTGRHSVEASYEVAGNGEVKFKLGAYDRSTALVIDPVLVYSTFLGGSGGDVAYGVAVDSSGQAVVTGNTNSSDFPKQSAKQSANAGSGDAFVAKLNSTGTALVYSTYLGGSGADTGNAVFVDASGDAFVTGSTSSINFPAPGTPFQVANGGSIDAFVTQLSSTGDNIVYSSYLGGGGADFGQGIAVDSSGNAYVTGSTQSINFPVLNALQGTPAGGSDAFVTKVNFTGTAILYSTYLGGSDADIAQAIRVDSSGNAYVAGYTFSTNFPTSNPEQGANAGTGADAFVAKIDATDSNLLFSTYLGGSFDDRAFGIGIDGSGNVYVAGSTQSADFPTTAGAFQIVLKGSKNAFVSKLNPSGSTLVYSTYLGGSAIDQANGIAVDTAGDAFVTGYTQSSDFPLQQPVQAVLGIAGGSACGANPCSDAFITELNPTGTGLITSTFLGGNAFEFGQGITLDASGGVYFAGSTGSSNFPAVAGAIQGKLNGVAGNAFVGKMTSDNLPSIALTPATIDFGNQALNVRSAIHDVTITNMGTAPLSITAITAAGDFEADGCIGTIASSGGTCTLQVTYTPTSLGISSQQISITDNATNSPHIINVTGTGVAASTAVTLSPTSLTFGDQKVGTVSSAQTVTLTNTGTSVLTISQISTTGDFVQTNTCGATLNVLNVGQSCTLSVSFQPTGSGARTGTLSITDNASGSPQGAALSGNGLAVFSLSSSSPTVTNLVGTTTATFTISATADSGFGGAITFTCPTGLTCAFSPTSILGGQSTTLTVSSLPASIPNPFNFAVLGTSGSQSATINLTLLEADYSLTASPALNTIVSGGSAAYTVSVVPVNGFNQAVQMSCLASSLPSGASCSFSESSVTPNGSAATVNMTVFTNKVAATPPTSGAPFQGMPPLLLTLASLLLLSGLYGRFQRRRASAARGLIYSWKVSALGFALLFLAGLTGCRPANTSSNTGTATGNYTIQIVGTLGSNTTVTRTTTVNLSVT